MDVRARRRRGRSLAVAGALVLTTTLASGVSAQTQPGPEADEPQSRGIDRVCPPPGDDGVPDAPADRQFSDSEGVHGDAIECAGTYLLAAGYDDGTFRPAEPITRAQMATFVANWIETATGEDLAIDPDADYFPDVAGVHADAIRKLAEAGIVRGRDDGTYGPAVTVSRGQMARFVANAIDYADTFEVNGSMPPADETDYFEDTAASAFEADIRRITGVGIAEGTGERTYGVGHEVTRGQMASFLLRSADYADREQRWLPTAVVAEYLVPLSGLSVVDEDGTAGQGELGAAGQATITVDAFDNMLEFTIDVSEFSGPYASSGGVAIHLGEPGENGEAVIPLATGAQLEAAQDGIVTGTVSQLDVSHRFADVVEQPFGYYVLVTSDGYPDGAARGSLAEEPVEDPIDGEEPPGDEIPIPGPPEE
ncbi:MAG TPA: S-layer homology domain-containing protein [Egicoccus sp.]|nr:S-layer homology domain-containing protein [Egicoccus sp.]HSK22154.1 S-layer homology domain-containing protein [Egicoccus sp.]